MKKLLLLTGLVLLFGIALVIWGIAEPIHEASLRRQTRPVDEQFRSGKLSKGEYRGKLIDLLGQEKGLGHFVMALTAELDAVFITGKMSKEEYRKQVIEELGDELGTKHYETRARVKDMIS